MQFKMITVDWSQKKKQHEDYIENYPYEDITLTAEMKKALKEKEHKAKRLSLHKKWL